MIASTQKSNLCATRPQYYVEDLLGTSRVMTTNTGTLCYDADFDPFGGEHAFTSNCATSNNYKFEGKERDTETGNDDFGARYYTSRFGRWLSADWSSVPVAVPYANLTNPQTLNLYAMVADDPETSADLDGHDCTTTAPGGISCKGDTPTTPPTTGEGSGSTGTGESSTAETVDQAQQQAAQNANDQNAQTSNQQAQQQNPDATQSQNQDQTQQNQPPTKQNEEKKQDQKKDQQETPLEAGSGSGGGRQPRGGERGKTSKPDNPRKHSRPSKEHPGQWEVQDHQTGKWVLKPKGWSPEATKRVILGVEVGLTGYVIYRVVRMLPSLAPPLWETIPANLAIP